MVASVNTQAQEVGEGNWYLGQVRKEVGNGLSSGECRVLIQ